jgi:hypothetical protein
MIGTNALSRVKHVTVNFPITNDTLRNNSGALNSLMRKICQLLCAHQLQSLHTKVIGQPEDMYIKGNPSKGRSSRCGATDGSWLSQQWNGGTISFTALTSLTIENHRLGDSSPRMKWPPSLTSLSVTNCANLNFSHLPSSCTRISLKECCWHRDYGMVHYDSDDNLPLQLLKRLPQFTHITIDESTCGVRCGERIYFPTDAIQSPFDRLCELTLTAHSSMLCSLLDYITNTPLLQRLSITLAVNKRTT